YTAWQTRFGSDPSVIGRTLRLNGENFEVIGVLPSMTYPWFDCDVWVTIQHYPNYRIDRAAGAGLAIGRIKDGVTRAHAAADLDTIAHRLMQQYPQEVGKIHIELDTLQEVATQTIKPMLLLL